MTQREQLIEQIKSFHTKWLKDHENVPLAFLRTQEAMFGFMADFALALFQEQQEEEDRKKIAKEYVKSFKQPRPEDVSIEQALRVVGWLWGNDHLKNMYGIRPDDSSGRMLLTLASQISNELNKQEEEE